MQSTPCTKLAAYMYTALLESLDSWGFKFVVVQEIGAILYHAAELQRQAEDELQLQADAEAERLAAKAETARQAAEASADQAAARLLADRQSAVAAAERHEADAAARLEADQQAADLRAQKLAAAQDPQQQVPEAAPPQQTAGALAAARTAEAPQAPAAEAAVTRRVGLSPSCAILCRHTALCKHMLLLFHQLFLGSLHGTVVCTRRWTGIAQGPTSITGCTGHGCCGLFNLGLCHAGASPASGAAGSQ